MSFNRIEFWTAQSIFSQEQIDYWKKQDNDFAKEQVAFWEDQLKKDLESLSLGEL